MRALNEKDKEKYLEMRDELAKSVMRSMGDALPGGATARQSFRVAHIYPIEIDNMYKSVTREVSLRRITTNIQGQVRDGQTISFAIRASRDGEPIIGKAKVASQVAKVDGTIELTLDIASMGPESVERLELALFDSVLTRF